MNIALLTLLSFFTLLSCTNAPQNKLILNHHPTSIINGEPVINRDGLSKSVVGILMYYNMSATEKAWIQGCTATVIDQKTILTAAHCVDGFQPEELAINLSFDAINFETQFNPQTRISDSDVMSKLRAVKIKNFRMHPEYKEDAEHDIAVIVLNEDLPAEFAPATFLPENTVNLDDLKTVFDGQTTDVVLIGFGVFQEDPRQNSEVLRQTTTPARFQNQFVITDQSKGSGGCNGDSGGPAFFKWNDQYYLVGVTHGPYGDATTCHEQGQWLNPNLFKQFITNSIEAIKAN